MSAGKIAAFFLALSLGFTTPPVTADNLGFDVDRLGRVDDMARTYVEDGLLPGVMYGVVRSGGVVHVSGVGDYERDDVFRIYSMTKPITAVATLVLMEEGKLLLTDPVARYLPEFAEPRVMLDDGSTRPASRPITIRHLLTHTAGLTYGGGESRVSKLYGEADLWSAGSLTEFSHRVAALPLVDDPGELWRYSVSLDILGRLVEVVSGMSLEAFMASRIFRPLGMVDTTFTLRDDQRARFVPLFNYREGGMTPAGQGAVDSFVAPNFAAGGGGLVSTLPDYLRFARMLLNDGELDGARVLSRKTVDLMMADHAMAMNPSLKVNESWLGRTENRNGSAEFIGFGFGLGGAVVRDPARNGVAGSVGTYGWGGTGNTYVFIDRKENVSGVFFTQLRPSGTYPVRSQFRALVYQALE